MKDLLPYYERELDFIRNGLRQFGMEYPATANHLHLIGEQSADPHVERLIQASALLNARNARQLDNGYVRFTSALLDQVQPHMLRPFPSSSIVHVAFDEPGPRKVHGVTVLPKGTGLKSHGRLGAACRFRTTSEIVLAPVGIAAAAYSQSIGSPPGIRAPSHVTAKITLTIAGTDGEFDPLSLDKLRVFIDGARSFVATLRDALFLGSCAVFVETGDEEQWHGLPASPLLPVGFDTADALLPSRPGDQPAYRLLSEFFTFPEKFNFFDIDLAAIRAIRPDIRGTFALHVLLADTFADSERARVLGALDTSKMLLGCAPVVNLFTHAGTPIRKTDTHTDYLLAPDEISPQFCEIYSIDRVLLSPEGQARGSPLEVMPMHARRFGSVNECTRANWIAWRDDEMRAAHPGYAWRLAFVDGGFDPCADETGSVSTMLTCTNRDLPASLVWGAREGDLLTETAPCPFPIRVLRKPTVSYRVTQERHIHWKLISHLALNHHSLAEGGADALRELLRLYAPADAAAPLRQIDGIAGVEQKPTIARMRHRGGSAFVHGIEVRVTLDEDAYAGASIHAFVQLLDHVFGLLVHLNSFTQVVALSKQSGKELLRCLPRNGTLKLV